MKTVIASDLSEIELKGLLSKPAFDQVELGEKALDRIQAMFGQRLTAAQVVDTIIADVRERGDAALLHYSATIDGAGLQPQTLGVRQEGIDEAYQRVDAETLAAIRQAADNVRRFHREQLPKSWFTERDHGSLLGQKCSPIDRAGIYVPGGTAAYPSSVLMNAIPAAVAGVSEIIMVVPPAKDGTVNPHVLVAANEAGVHRIFRLGGAQAVAALAFGTQSVPKVDKITGPGNIFVTLAKKAVYGYCDIDMLAGPSEILIVADDTADPRHVAADMLSQAEHDTLASSILITDSVTLARQVEDELAVQLARLPRQEIAAESLAKNGLIVITGSILEAIRLANLSAPEHLELLTADPFSLLNYVRHAGAVFLGHWSPEPLGDYLAGPNHVLPTGGTARFYSVLNVETFMKKTSIISYSRQALAEAADQVIRLAEAEGLSAHANAIRVRRECPC